MNLLVTNLMFQKVHKQKVHKLKFFQFKIEIKINKKHFPILLMIIMYKFLQAITEVFFLRSDRDLFGLIRTYNVNILVNEIFY